MKRDGVWFFFLATFAVTWGFGAAYALFPHALVAVFGPPSGTSLGFRIAVAAPSLCAIAAAALFAGRRGLADLFARLFCWRVGVQWYALATLGVAALGLAGRYFSGTLHATDVDVVSRWQTLLWIGVSAFWMDAGPLGEELGWRGFALPRLDQRMSGRRAALLLGAIWSLWHLPAFLFSGLPQNALPLWTFLIGTLSLGVLIAWIVNNARGSVIIAILAHWAANRFGALDAANARYTAAVFAAAAIAVIVWAGPSLGSARMPPPPGSKPD